MRRFLTTHRGYVAIASATLSLAVGINLLVFAIANALWLRPLAIHDPAHVVTILQYRATVTSLDAPMLEVFDGPVAGQIVTTGFYEAFKTRITLPQVAEPLESIGVTPSYFDVLGVPVRGRVFTAADEQPGAEAVAIVSDRLWTRAFGHNPNVLGTVVDTAPRRLRIIGIAPPRFEGARRGERADLWLPTEAVRDMAPDDRQIDTPGMMVFARLGPGQTPAALEALYRARLIRPDGSPDTNAADVRIAPLTEVFGTSDSPSILIREGGTLAVVSALALLVLLGGCATIAALVLTHYERRRPELAIRASLGASRSRLVRDLAAELLVVASIGSAGAVLCGLFATRVLPALRLPGGVNVGGLDLLIDWRACVVALSSTGMTLALAAVVPLWRVTHGRLASEVVAETNTPSVHALRVRRRLLALQVAATTVVLIASGLFIRTVLHSFSAAAGFDIDRTVFVSVQERSLRTAPGVNGLARQTQILDALSHIPSVRAAASGTPPIGSDALTTNTPRSLTIRVSGRDEQLLVGVFNGGPNLLSTLGVPLLAGRPLDRSDSANVDPTPVVVTRSLAARLWPSGNALGQVFGSRPGFPRTAVVVGIAGDFAFGTLARPVTGVVVTARGDLDFRVSNVVLQTDDVRGVVSALQRMLADRVVRVTTGRDIVAHDIGQQRLGAWAFSGFGLVALLLGIGGVFALVSYLAQSRQREFGVRMALGASLSDIVRGALTAALGPVALGVATGLILGALASRVFSALLVGVNGLDPGTYAAVGAVIALPATLAALAGAARLRHLSPSDALRRR